MLIINHFRSLWGKYWLLPLMPLGFLAVVAGLGELRPELVIIAGGITLLALATPQTKAFIIAVAPGIAIGFGYELVRYLRPFFVTAERTLGCELKGLELLLFSGGGTQTLSDYFAEANSTFLDLFFAVPYTAFWMFAIAYAVFLYFWRPEQMHRYLWLLALTHAVAFVIWLWLPAAPPWYVRAYGCDIDTTVLPNAAALLRVDALFGMNYFESFYSRSPNVFGALPSLHCTFPVAGLLAAWRGAGWPERLAHLGYALWMLVASVYLGHHWLLDGLLGIAIVVAVNALIVRMRPVRLAVR